MRFARNIMVAAAIAALPLCAHAQSTVLQGGPWVPGHVPMYYGSGSQTPVILDGGGAGGGNVGTSVAEIGVTAKGTGTPPYAAQGTGPYGTNICDYDAPTNNPTGYHYICLTANGGSGALIAVGSGGGAAPLAMSINVNGTVYPFPGNVLTPGLFSALVPCSAGVEGQTGAVTNSTTNTWGATITGGGSFHVLAYCDSTAWTVAAK